MTPARSASDRFWLSLAFASTRSTASSSSTSVGSESWRDSLPSFSSAYDRIDWLTSTFLPFT